jgi:uncharacterized protein YjbJ (UPF0337 family)
MNRSTPAAAANAARHPLTHQGVSMNKDQVTGTVKEAAGKVQQKTGQLIGSRNQQAKGIAKQIDGKIEQTVGDVKEVLKDAKAPK